MLRKKITLSVALLFFTVAGAFADSEISLFTEITSAYNGNSYPTVIEYCNRLEKEYPQSLLLRQAYVYKGESYFKQERYTEACTVLENACSLNAKESALLLNANYWKGRSHYCLKQYDSALSCFSKAISVYRENEVTSDTSSQDSLKKSSRQKKTGFSSKEISAYNNSIFYSAKAFSIIENYSQTVACSEYIVANGKDFTKGQYNEILVILFRAYEKLNSDRKIISLYEQIKDEEAVLPVRDYLMLSAGDSYAKCAEYRKANECYKEVLAGNKQELASIALQKSYLVASEHSSEVNEDPGKILSVAQHSLQNYPELVAEFWTRLGTDSFNAGQYDSAKKYFDSAEKDASRDNKLLAGLYRAAIALKLNSVNSASESISVLDKFSEENALKEEDVLYADYMLSYMRSYAFNAKWNEVKKYAGEFQKENVFKKDSLLKEFNYWYALALYKTNESKTAEYYLNDFSVSECLKTNTGIKEIIHKAVVLKAVVLAKNGNDAESASILKTLDENNLLAEDEILDYAEILLAQGYLSSAYRMALRVQSPKAWYIAALSSFNRKDWITSEMYFKKCLVSKNAYEPFALFYCGYAQYRLGKSIEAYNTLVQFTKKYPSHVLAWNAYMTSANAALVTFKFDQAAEQVEKAIKCASAKEQEQQGIILCSNIYCDAEKYDKALTVIEPYTSLSSEFGVECRFQKALILSKQGKSEESDLIYKSISEQFKSNALADDASYRRGEIFYSNGNYSEAVSRFENYRAQFSKGKYADASYFYEADCCVHMKNNDRAIILYLALINSLPKSSYIYSAKKNLMQLYTDSGDYNEALHLAENILVEFKTQAEKEGIVKQISTLRQLAGGEDELIVKKKASFENSGGLTSRKGRNEGSELASLLWKNSGTQSEALSLVAKLLPLQTSKENLNAECGYAAANEIILAQTLRNRGENKQAAEEFLKAAQYAKMCGRSETVCRALYGAVEAFDAEGIYGDAKEAYETMNSMYPENEYTKQAQHIVKGEN